MKNDATFRKNPLYLGVDIGGTKVQASLVRESGGILQRERQPTPRTGGPEQVLAVVEKVMEDVLNKGKVAACDLAAVGVAVPGVVDPDSARVIVTPNMSLTGVAIGAHLEGRFHVPVAVGNDGNLGTLGETWLGSARDARSALGIWVGTGIGAGLVLKGKLCARRPRIRRRDRPHRHADRRSGMRLRKPRLLGGLGQPHGHRARHPRGPGRRPNQRPDRTDRRRPERHPQRLDPPRDSGGRRPGLRHLTTRRRSPRLRLPDRSPPPRPGGHRAGRGRGRGVQRFPHADRGDTSSATTASPAPATADKSASRPSATTRWSSARWPWRGSGLAAAPSRNASTIAPRYPEIISAGCGEITVGRKTHRRDIYIHVNGKVKKRAKSLGKPRHGQPRPIRPKELRNICRGGPEILFIGAGKEGKSI